jgi:hypothetical protein
MQMLSEVSISKISRSHYPDVPRQIVLGIETQSQRYGMLHEQQ